MKKIFGIILLFLSFCIVDKVEAIHCLYRSEAHGVDFSVHSYSNGNSVFASPLNSFEIEGEKKGESDYWMTGTMPWEKNLKVVDKDYEQISKDDKCYNFMYYDAVWGTNKIYFSDDDTIPEDYDIKLELLGPYKDSEENAILKEMVCNYTNSKQGTSNDYITFKIAHDGEGNGTYELWDNNKKLYSNSFSNYTAGTLTTVDVEDHFSIRIFWNEDTGKYVCPEAIHVGVDTDINAIASIIDTKLELGYDTSHMDSYSDSVKADGFLWSVSHHSYLYQFYRDNQASYIKYDVAPIPQSQICNYSREGEGGVDGVWHMALTEYKPNNKPKYFATYFNEPVTGKQRNVTSYSVTSGILDKSCENLPFIYTDCLNVEPGQSCSVSEKFFSRKDSQGKELVEKLEEEEWRNAQDIKDAMIGMGEFTGYKYKQMVCELYDHLKYLPNASLLNKTSKLDFYDYEGKGPDSRSITNLACKDWEVTTSFSCDDEECKSQIEYLTEKKIREITSYCKNKYSNFSVSDLSDGPYRGRMEECIKFEEFYGSLVNNGIVRDLSNGCNIFSDDFVGILTDILDIMKIAGPILALGLGTLDFIKAIASGDADKEMKNAFKRFSTRITAAILLFIIPFILAFLMDTFIGNQNGYDADNPFCDLAFKDES